MCGSIEFTCEGCGVYVLAFGIVQVPSHQFCAMCAWLCEHIPDPEEMMAMRTELDMLNPAKVTKATGTK